MKKLTKRTRKELTKKKIIPHLQEMSKTLKDCCERLREKVATKT